MENHPPIKQRYYSVSPEVHAEIVTEVDSMLANDVIQPSCSGWSSLEFLKGELCHCLLRF